MNFPYFCHWYAIHAIYYGLLFFFSLCFFFCCYSYVFCEAFRPPYSHDVELRVLHACNCALKIERSYESVCVCFYRMGHIVFLHAFVFLHMLATTQRHRQRPERKIRAPDYRVRSVYTLYGYFRRDYITFMAQMPNNHTRRIPLQAAILSPSRRITIIE